MAQKDKSVTIPGICIGIFIGVASSIISAFIIARFSPESIPEFIIPEAITISGPSLEEQMRLVDIHLPSYPLVAGESSLRFNVRVALLTIPGVESLDFIDGVSCDVSNRSPIVEITEPQECFFIVENKNQSGEDQDILLRAQICHPEVRNCADGEMQMTVYRRFD